MGRAHTAESRTKLSIVAKLRTETPEGRIQCATAHLGKQHSHEAKTRMSEAKRSKPSVRKGLTASEETRAKLSAAAKTRWADPETRAAILAANKPPPRHISAPTWTPEMMDRLRALWPDQSLSASAIGREMGLTKNQVVSKVNRLDLPRRASPLGSASPTRNRNGGKRGHSEKTREKLRAIAAGRAASGEQNAMLTAAKRAKFWTVERLDGLRTFWPQKEITVRQIGARLGISFKTVARKAKELSLPSRVSGMTSQAALRSLGAKRASGPVAPKPPRQIEHIPAPADGGTTGERGCRWPLWSNDRKPGTPHLFCGQARVVGKSYCPACCAIAYSPMRVLPSAA